MIVKSNKKRIRYNSKKAKKEISVKTLNQDQVNAIIETSNLRDRSIMYLLLNTGLRVSELINLNYKDLFKDLKKRIVKDIILVSGKGNKIREIPLNSIAKKAILNIHHYNKKVLKVKEINNRNPILISRIGTRLSRQAVGNITRKIGTNPHTFRHTFGTQLAKQNNRIEIISSIMGHSSTDITNKFYIEKTIEDKIKAVETIEIKAERNLKLINL